MGLSKDSNPNVPVAPILAEGYVSKPIDEDTNPDLLTIGKLELDLTNNQEQAILDILGAVINGYHVVIYPKSYNEIFTEYDDLVEALEVIHFAQET